LHDLVGDGAGAGETGGFLLDVDEGVIPGGAVGALEDHVRQGSLGGEAGGDVESTGFGQDGRGDGILFPYAQPPAAFGRGEDIDEGEGVVGEDLVDEFREPAGGGFFQGLEAGFRLQEETGGMEGGGGNLGLGKFEADLVETPNGVS
jgi:hypothetical protein